MQPTFLALFLILADSTALKQGDDVNSLQPLQSMIQLFGDTLDFAIRDLDRMLTQLLYPEQANAMLTQLLSCDEDMWSEVLPRILSDDLERLTITCQDSNRTALLNTMLEDIGQGMANSTDPCMAFNAQFQIDIRAYLNTVSTQGWQLDLGWTSSEQQYSVPLDTVVDNLQQLPGFLTNDPTDSGVAGLRSAINTLSTDVSDTELADSDDFARIVDAGISVMVTNSNQLLSQTLVQFLNEAASLLCSIIGPPSTDSQGRGS